MRWLVPALVLLQLGAAAPQGEPQAAATAAETAMELIRGIAQAEDLNRWFATNGDKITSEVAAAADAITGQGMSQGQYGLAHAASMLAAMAHLRLGEREQSLASMRNHLQIAFMLAQRPEQYSQARAQALGMVGHAKSIERLDLAFAFATLAADCAYFESNASEGEARAQALLTALEDLERASSLSKHSTELDWTERFVSLAGAVVDKATERIFQEQEKFEALLGATAASVEQRIPADFEYKRLQAGDVYKTIETARALALLSYRYGNPAVASARLAIAEKRAQGLGDAELMASLISGRYRGEADAGASAEQLRRLRDEALASAQEIRAGYRSRAGRIWAAYRSDVFFGEMLKGQLTDTTADQMERVFSASELLKARMLLDRLALPRPREIDTEETRGLERRVLGYEEPKLQGDLLADEMYLVSQLSGFDGVPGQTSDRAMAMWELEEIYKRGDAGFTKAASPVSLRDLQGKLRSGEALLEYVIPYHPLHPASDLWMMLVTRDRVWSAQVSLDETLGLASFTGRMSVDGAPPVDASALGDHVSLLRTDIRSSNDKAAALRLRLLHDVLVQPLLDEGVRLEDLEHLIVVPHGVLHYVPFPALIDAQGSFLIGKVAMSVTPSASVWSILASRTSAVDRFVGFANPELEGRDLPELGFAEEEVLALAKTAPAGSRKAFTASEATKERFLGEAPKASLLHVSTHGEFPDENALDLHAIWLGDAVGSGVAVRASEVRRMKLGGVKLAVLNVCNGGLYRMGPSDEPYGLVPALFEAGAQTVLGTLWPMDDRFARDFMLELYSHLDEGPAKAYRKAALRFIGEDEYIRRWAGYILAGSGRATGGS